MGSVLSVTYHIKLTIEYCFNSYNQIIAKFMKVEHKNLQNINSLKTQCTLTEIIESKIKTMGNFSKNNAKQFMPVFTLQSQIEQNQIKRKSGTVFDLDQLLQINHGIIQQNEENLSQIIDCAHIQPISKKKMSKSSFNELQDINFSHLECNVGGVQLSTPQVACNPLQQNNYYTQVYNSDQQLNKQRKQTSLERYYRRFYKDKHRIKWNKSVTDQSCFKNILTDRNPGQIQNLSKKQIKPNKLKVIQPINTKQSYAVQNQSSQMHLKELNYGRTKNSIKLKDYLYQNQLSSKIKLYKRKETQQRKRIEKKNLVSSVINGSAPLNPLKHLVDKQRKFSVKSSEILQIVKTQILSELKDCSQTIKNISSEIEQIQSWLEQPKDEDLWKIFELKRNIQQCMSIKLKNALQDLRIKKIALRKKQKK